MSSTAFREFCEADAREIAVRAFQEYSSMASRCSRGLWRALRCVPQKACTVSQSPQPARTAAMRRRRGLRVDGGWVTISSAKCLATTIDRLLDGAQES
jgi:hypothetical protein